MVEGIEIMKWAHLAVAPDQMTAELWVSILRDQGIAAMIRPSDVVSYLGISAFGCRVQVDEDELERAREIIGVEDEEDGAAAR
ncbi:MAG: hypothetical protein GEU75_10290 [Dehalococcoidia bacterium]|nr:hypothetical protein [Dehalococcoidia bacterium]